MDSTGPDPPSQQQQQQPQQPQQPQQQPHPQQQPKPQHHPQHHQPNPPPYHPQMQAFQHGTYYRPIMNYTAYSPYGPYSHYQAPPTWYPGPTFSPAPAQQLSSMVNPQPQSNVPQPPKPGSQIVSPSMNADGPNNQSLQSLAMSNQAQYKKRPTTKAVLRDPKTKVVVNLGDDDTNTAANSPSTTTKPSSNTATSTKPSVEHVHTLLQKVSEDNSSEVKNDQDSSSSKNKTEVEAGIPEEEKVNGSGVDSSKEKKDSPPISVDEQPKPNDVLVLRNDDNTTTETNSSSSTPKPPSNDSTPKQSSNPSTPKLSSNTSSASNTTASLEHVHTLLQKVSEDNNSEVKDDQDSSSSTTKVEEEASIPKEEKINGNEDGNDSSKEEDKESEDVEAALHYEPWQYNPISNKTGKKIYSRDFLLEVCKVKKLNLKQERDDKIGEGGNQFPYSIGDKIDMFTPTYASSSNRGYAPSNRQTDPTRRQNQNYSGRSSAGQEKQRKIISSASLTQDVELKPTENPWRPTKEIKEDAPNSDVVETESLKKKFRSILNKLTPNNFENLAKAVTDLHIDTESKLGEVIDIVFAKALSEPGYCVLYGRMCSHLKKITAGAANFGNTLLKRCQHQFQSDIYSGLNLNERKEKIDAEEDQEIKKQLNEELYEDMYRCRMRGLGLIKFIGELYKIEMLNDAIMFDCVLRLLSDTSEESLECLCDLLATIGEKLDRSSQKNAEKEKKTPKSASKANAYQGGQKSAAAVVASGSTAAQQQKAGAEIQPVLTTLDQVFEQLHKIRKNKDLPLSVRIRFKLLDTCELREKENWQSKKTKDNNPKKIEEIREAHKEKLEQERRQQNAMGPRRSQEGRRLGHSGGSSSQISSLANESGNKGSSTMHTSSSSHLLRDHSIGDTMKTNHNDIETHKEHQRKIENIKTFGFLKSLKTSSNEPLRPSSQFSLRPGYKPVSVGAAAASAAASTRSAEQENEAKEECFEVQASKKEANTSMKNNII